ncbi:MAG: glycoside hydrolase family 38 C-terminal domain-containing protein [Bacteroidota bacterium]
MRIFFTFMILLLPPCLIAQQMNNGIIINVKDGYSSTVSNEVYLNGYRKTIDGQILDYHSSHPDAGSALLVRAQKEAQSISWETDTLIAPPAGEYYRFVWLAGLEKGGWGEHTLPHQFELFINGEHWFTFFNSKNILAEHWALVGKNGSELSFKSLMADRFNDLFGYMFLSLSKKDFQSGMPLTLKVVGEDAGSMDWYMTFQYRFNFVPRVRVEPVLLRDSSGNKQMLRVSLDNLQQGRTIEMTTPSGELITKPLALGANIFTLPIPVVTAESDLPLEFSINGKTEYTATVKIAPVQKRDVYLLCYSHNDIGYTDVQPVVRQKQWDNIESALKLIDRTRDYPPEARYKWNIEILWPLESYMNDATESKRQAALDAIRNGGIGLNALYVNPLTGLANAVEMSHYLDYAREFTAKYSIPITSAVVSDIPGFTWGIVPALAQSGVIYFSSAPNPGDRTGYVYENWGDKPFYWTSQSGGEKVLMWLAGAGYASFHEGQLAKLGDEKILKLLRKLDETVYPYDIYPLPYTLGDNGGTDSTLPDFVKRWNERYAAPRLIIATHTEMFEAFEKQYGASLPSYKGDFTPYWEDGAMSTAYETIESRRAVDRLIQGEALWSMKNPAGFPASKYQLAWRNVSLYDEHTWGASNSISEPDSPNVKAQWNIKKQFAVDADSLSRALLHEVLNTATEKTEHVDSFDVWNTNSWVRTDLVFLTPEQSSAGDRVVDVMGKSRPSQRLSTGSLAVLIRDIGPMSTRRFYLKKGKTNSAGKVRIGDNSLENMYLSVAINPQTGTISSIHSKITGDQYADSLNRNGINSYYYVPGKNADSALFLKNVRVRIKEKGTLVSSFVVEGDAPGCRGYKSEIRLTEGINRIDIIDEIDKLPVRNLEAVHIAFPFNVPDGQIRYDVAGGIVEPEKDQLPGSCKNFFSVQSWVDVSREKSGITLASIDVPLIEIGSITAEQPWMKAAQSSSKIYSYVMNNYWHTNYKADQEGKVEFRYSLTPHRAFDGFAAERFGVETRQPLVVAPADGNKPDLTGQLYWFEPAVVLSLSTKPLPDGEGWLLYIYNPAPSSQDLKIRWNKSIPVEFSVSDPSGNRGIPFSKDMQIPAYGTLYVRVDKK